MIILRILFGILAILMAGLLWMVSINSDIADSVKTQASLTEEDWTLVLKVVSWTPVVFAILFFLTWF